MSDPSVRNLNALVLGTGEFLFSMGATSLADAKTKGWHPFGNIVAAAVAPEIETIEHEGSYRGLRRVDKRYAIKSGLSLRIRCDEWDREKVKYAIFGENATNITQTAIVSTAIDALPFTTTPAVINNWYQLQDSGVPVREVTAITIPGKTEDTDFVLDGKLGCVRFMAAESSDLTPTISASAIASGDNANLKGITPLQSAIKEGYGWLRIFDDTHANKLVLEYRDFKCQVSLENAGEFEGRSLAELTMLVTIMEDVGTFYTAE